MDTIGGDAGGEWSSLCGLLTTEEAEFMAQLLGFSSSNWAEMGGNSSFGGVPTSLWPAHESGKNEEVGNAASFYANAGTHSESSFGLLSDSNSSMEMEFLVVDDAANTTSCYLNIDPDDCLSQGTSDDNVRLELKRPSETLDPKPKAQERSTKIPELPNKRSRNSGNVQNGKRNVRPKKKQRNALTDKEEEDHDAGFNGQSPSSCSSEDDVNRSQELSGVAASGCSLKEQPALNSKGKARAGRGAAADPQSIYARKRRERINERLRTLQNLVPNGTKVDISTMLEEAVQYVKFLQLQIKLLSSDDLWMYAPIAYNGVDIGLDLRLTLPKRTS